MLQATKQFEPSTRFDLILRGIDAYDPETKAELRQSGGRTSKAPKWFLFFGERFDTNGHYRPYKEWRHTFRAWTLGEAIEHANKKLPRLMER